MKALVGAFNQEKALVGAFSVIVQPVVEPMKHYTALIEVLDPVNNACFGNSLSKFILDSFLGYDDVLMSSIKSLAEKEDNKVEDLDFSNPIVHLLPNRNIADSLHSTIAGLSS